MNDIKDALLSKMGNTKERAIRVRKKVNQQKRKNNRNRFYYVALSIVTTAVLLFLLYPLFDQEQQTAIEKPTPTYEDELKAYFMEDGTTAYYKGVGNEFASYRETTYWLSDRYVQLIKDNGGAVVERVYRITEDEIRLVLEEEIAEETVRTTDIDKLEGMATQSVFLKLPIEQGMKLGNQTVVETDGNLETVFGEFSHVLVLREESDASQNDVFLAKNYGVIKHNFKSKEDNYVVSSELASIGTPYVEQEEEVNVEVPVNAEMPDTVTVKSKLTGEAKSFIVADMPPIRERLQESSDYGLEVSKMAYIELYLPDSSAKYFFLETACEQNTCNVFLVKESTAGIQTLAIGEGLVDEYAEFSPNMKRALIRFAKITSEEVIRHRLVAVDLSTMKLLNPASGKEYFMEYTLPIEKYNWLNDERISILTADIDSYTDKDIRTWRSGAKDLREIQITIQ
ncbi:hypothetical protein [Lysinibacillus sp. 54212]|uniref:hypothetical protein n=1 Tax=Lysinibacillus sp. 54212 TaxID=3119829 RepID=UPI002FC6F28E